MVIQIAGVASRFVSLSFARVLGRTVKYHLPIPRISFNV